MGDRRYLLLYYINDEWCWLILDTTGLPTEATKEAVVRLTDSYGKDGILPTIDDPAIFEYSNMSKLDLAKYRKVQIELAEKKRQKIQEEIEHAEYLRLKRKYEDT